MLDFGDRPPPAFAHVRSRSTAVDGHWAPLTAVHRGRTCKHRRRHKNYIFESVDAIHDMMTFRRFRFSSAFRWFRSPPTTFRRSTKCPGCADRVTSGKNWNNCHATTVRSSDVILRGARVISHLHVTPCHVMLGYAPCWRHLPAITHWVVDLMH